MKKSSLHFQLKAVGLVIFVLFCALTTIAQSRDLFEIGATSSGEPEIFKYEFKAGLPPIRINQSAWLNSFGYQRWNTSERKFTQFRWGPALNTKLNETQNLFILAPFNLASDENSPELESKRLFYSLIATLNNKVSDSVSWSYGLIVTDKTNAHRIYPAIGARIRSADEKWFFNLGFPTLSLTYLGFSDAELSLGAGRESATFYTEALSTAGHSRYTEINLNSLSLGYKYKKLRHAHINIRYAYLFSSEINLLDAGYTKLNQVQNLHEQSQISLTLSVPLVLSTPQVPLQNAGPNSDRE